MKQVKFLTTALIFLVTLGLIYSCENLGVDPEMDDAELIAAIQNSTAKQAVSIDELPSGSVTVLESDYSEDFVSEANLAPELGYEVNLKRGMGSFVGESDQAYFDLNGRQLNTESDIAEGNGSDRPHRKRDKKRKRKKDCFKILFPFNLTMPDGSTITLESEEDWSQVREWYEANESDERPAFVFPIQINYAGSDEAITINNEEEFEEAKELCRDGKRPRKCFDFVYPFTFTMPDGSSITLNEDADWELVKAWYDDNPDIDQRPDIVFPVDIKFGGEVITVNNEDELQRIHDACKERMVDFRCFKIAFPYSVTMPDGSTITLESHEDHRLIKEWYENNPDIDVRPQLVFPVTIIYTNGETVTINNEEELERVKEACSDD